MRKLARILFVLMAALAISGALFGVNSSSSRSGCASGKLERNDTNFFSTVDTYRFLWSLRKAGCSTLGKAEFDQIVAERDLNIVSFAVLEGRVTDLEQRDAPAMIAEYADKLVSYEGGVSENLVVTLTDVMFDKCAGSESCLEGALETITAGRKILGEAGCLFGMKRTCEKTISVNKFQLNSHSIKVRPDSADLKRARERYFCERYSHCVD